MGSYDAMFKNVVLTKLKTYTNFYQIKDVAFTCCENFTLSFLQIIS